MLKKIGMAIIISTMAMAEISISGIESNEGFADFRDEVFNRKIIMPEGCMPIKEALKFLEEVTGHTVVNNTLIDLDKPVCNLHKYKKTGDVLDAIIKDKKKIYYTHSEGIDTYIVISNANHITTTFPMYWQIDDTLTHLKKEFPKLKWVAYGTTIKAQGSKEDLNEAKNKLNEIREFAMRNVPVKIGVSKINLGKNKEIFPKVRIMSRLEKGISQGYSLMASHGNQIQLREVPVPIEFDLQQNTVKMGEHLVPIQELPFIAFLFGDLQITIDFGGLFYNGDRF